MREIGILLWLFGLLLALTRHHDVIDAVLKFLHHWLR